MNTTNARSEYSLAVIFGAAGANDARVDVEFAMEKDLTSPTAFTIDTMNDLQSSLASSHKFPVTAFRLNVREYTTGTITLRILQSND